VGVCHAANVMDIEHVDPRHAQALLTIVVAAHHAIVTVVENLPERQIVPPFWSKRTFRRFRRQLAAGALARYQAADLGGNDMTSISLAQDLTYQMFDTAPPIKRCSVEITNAQLPGRR